MKRRLEVALVPHYIAKLYRLPAVFLFIEGGVENRGVAMKLRIGRAIYRPCRPVNILGPDHIPRGAIGIGSVLANARADFRFDFRHRFAHRLAERIQDAFIASQFQRECD